jgi:hypothetical protein
MDQRDLRITAYVSLFLYLSILGVQVIRLYVSGDYNWHIGDWVVVTGWFFLLPGVPGLILIVPSKFLNHNLTVFLTANGVLGVLLSLIYGFVFGGEWLILGGVAIILNVVVGRLERKRRVLV